jgi:glycyl-tRNA synthetase alpha chain
LDLQTLILSLQQYWADAGCVVQQPYDVEIGAGTMHPETFLRVLGPEPYRVAYVQPSRRPADARYGENPFRLGRHLEEDNWEAPTLGAWGVGWQVLLDGMEITQFTYFQQAGGIELAPVSAELTYGLERIAMFLQRKDSIYDIEWGGGVPYGAVRLEDEREASAYGFEVADVEMLRRHLEDWEREAERCLDHDPPLVIPALEATLKISHLFNLLDARGAVSVTERVGLIGRTRRQAVRVAKAYVAQREALGFPLGNVLEEAAD